MSKSRKSGTVARVVSDGEARLEPGAPSAERARALQEAIEFHALGFAYSRIAYGLELLALKARVGHGNWEDWYRTNLERERFDARSARRYMEVGEAFAEHVKTLPESNRPNLADLIMRRCSVDGCADVGPAAGDADHRLVSTGAGDVDRRSVSTGEVIEAACSESPPYLGMELRPPSEMGPAELDAFRGAVAEVTTAATWHQLELDLGLARGPKRRGGDHGGGKARAEALKDLERLRPVHAQTRADALIREMRAYCLNEQLHNLLTPGALKELQLNLHDCLEAVRARTKKLATMTEFLDS